MSSTSSGYNQFELLGDFLAYSLINDSEENKGEEERARNGLFQGIAPDPFFFRTLARYAHFGKVQTALADKVKKRRPAGEMFREDGHAALGKLYLTTVDHIESTLAAAAWALLLRRHPAGVFLAYTIDRSAIKALAEDLYAICGRGGFYLHCFAEPTDAATMLPGRGLATWLWPPTSRSVVSVALGSIAGCDKARCRRGGGRLGELATRRPNPRYGPKSIGRILAATA